MASGLSPKASLRLNISLTRHDSYKRNDGRLKVSTQLKRVRIVAKRCVSYAPLRKVQPSPREQLGTFLLLLAAPLVFLPFTSAPFVDGKLVLVVAAAAVLAPGLRDAPGPLLLASFAWIAVVAAATVFSIDPWVSVFGTQTQGVGTIVLAAGAALLCSATTLSDAARELIPRFLTAAAAVVSIFAIVLRFVKIGGTGWILDPLGSTLGQHVFVGAFIGAAIIAGTALPRGWRRRIVLIVLASGLSVSISRAAWLGVAVGFAILFLGRVRRRDALEAAVITVVILAAWTLAAPIVPAVTTGVSYSAASSFSQAGESSTLRVPLWKAELRSVRTKPALGSGPATSWADYLSHASVRDIRRASRIFPDAHSIAIEFLATTGLLGLALFGLLLALVLALTDRTNPWGLAAAAALLVTHLVEPTNVLLTPMMLFLAGTSVARARAVTTRSAARSVAALGVGVVSVVLVAATMVHAAASALERYGTDYTSERSLRWAASLDPSRITASTELGRARAFDSLGGHRAARDDALSIARRIVARHPWDPQVRIEAANVAHVAGDDALAADFLRAHLRRFPHDPSALEGLAALELAEGDVAVAKRLAREALRADPTLTGARSTLRDASRQRPSVR